jgi:hypothetical protein
MGETLANTGTVSQMINEVYATIQKIGTFHYIEFPGILIQTCSLDDMTVQGVPQS